MKVLFITPYPFDEAPSQRFRFEQYYQLLDEKGIEYEVAPFLDQATWRILYKPSHYLLKTLGILRGFGRRFAMMFRVKKYQFVFIHREASPIGPPVFEWILAKVLNKRIIYDFDDSIWLSNTSSHNQIVAGVKWHGKVASICKWAYKVSCGNEFLCSYARRYNANVVLNPTTIDTNNLHNRQKNQDTDNVVIGWTGTHSTVDYLTELIPVLKKLETKFEFDFMVISNKRPDFNLKSLKYVPWKKETEIDDLMQFNFGVMPLTDDKWAKGKCGFKALQYMALGMPAVASPVGVNATIVSNGENGYLCNSPVEWEEALSNLLSDKGLRTKMGAKARQHIVESYSVSSNASTFLSLFTV